MNIILALLLMIPQGAPRGNGEPIREHETQVEGTIEGSWEGRLILPTAALRIVYHLSRRADGSLTATMDSPDQGALGIPVDTAVFEAGRLSLTSSRLAATFEGNLNSSGDEIAGTFRQGAAALPLVLRRAGAAGATTSLNRPQEPHKPYPYTEREVSYANPAAGITLAGTLTLPAAQPPSPAVILISGSGAQDRDETIFGHRPFLVLADYLTRRGIAVLRMDDRGVGGSSGSTQLSTTEDLAGDVRAGIEFLKGVPEIDAKRIGLIGHSEGGIVAPMAAKGSDDIAFLVLLAATAMPGEELLYRQGELLARAMGAGDAAVAKQRGLQEAIFAVVKSEKDPAAAETKLRAVMKSRAPGMAEAAQEQQIRGVVTPWFRYFLTYDPRPVLGKVQCPVLALGGERDLQVPPDENLAAIDEALKAAGNKDHTVQKLPGLNHLFQTARSGLPAEYGTIEETLSPQALRAIGDWIEKRFQTGPRR